MSAASEFRQDLASYLDEIRGAGNERQRAQYFIEFLRRDLDAGNEFVGYPTRLRPELEESLRGIEFEQQQDHTLTEFTGPPEDDSEIAKEAQTEEEKQTVFVSGRLDARVGNLILEFKDNLETDLEDAKEQLKTYVFLLHQEGVTEDFVCFATDGQQFRVYEALVSESLESRHDVELSELHTGFDLESEDPQAVQRWFRAFIEERVHPTVERIDDWFGVGSEIFEGCLSLMEGAYDQSEVAKVHFDEWRKYLEHAQGETLEDTDQESLFLRHTYLASFAKLLSYMVLVRSSIPSPTYATEILRGDPEEPLPENLFEQDLFAWIGQTEAGQELAEILVDALLNFDLGRVNQDIFKQLYQEMVSPDVRHDLGEFYTPDWLAEYIIQELNIQDDHRILDPGCGSGTFLVETIREKKNKTTRPPSEFLVGLQEEVVGIDVHPLAVAVAKANYVAAVDELLQYRRGRFQIPVYLADSVILELREEGELKTTELGGAEVTGSIEVGGEEYNLPRKALASPADLDSALDLVQEYLDDGSGFEWELIRQIPDFEDVSHVFERIRDKMATAAAEKRDSIHAFILKNFYRPLYLSSNGSFDAIIGNPPWLVYSNMGEKQKSSVKELLQEYGLHPGAHNVLNMELATLFMIRCIELYLKDQGKLGFVMPRSIYTGNQHDPFRRGNATIDFGLDLVLDLEDVDPLFNMPASTVFATKTREFGYPIKKRTFQGNLDDKNANWQSAIERLEIEESEIFLSGNGVTSWDEIPDLVRSDYHSLFRKGADLHPRPLVMAELDEQAEKFGFDPGKPPMRTSVAAQNATKAYEDVVLSCEVEDDFLYGTLIATDLVPFAHREFRTAILPAVPEGEGYQVIEADQAIDGGFSGLGEWLAQANEHWVGRGDRDTISQQVNFRQKVSQQNPNFSYMVVYGASGTNLVASTVESEEIENSETDYDLQGIIIDHALYYYYTDDPDEAHYLCAVLNSSTLNKMIKNLQSKGDFGEQNIHKSPLEFPIPVYNSEDPDHVRLAELAKGAERKALEPIPELEEQYEPDLKPMNIRWIREKVRDRVSEEIDEIDTIVENILSS